MPGIVGQLNYIRNNDTIEIDKMTETMIHKEHYKKEVKVYNEVQLGSAVLSETNNGVYEDEKYLIAFYGEVFEVRGYISLSDFPLQCPEKVLNYIKQYGFDVVKEFNGAFALALYEKKVQRLRLAVDRMSMHRLFFWESEDGIAFSSEAKAFYFANNFKPEPDYIGIQQLLTFRHTFGSRTFWKNVKELLPGSILTVEKGKVKTERYWKIGNEFQRKKIKSKEAYAKELYDILKRAVEIRTPSEEVSMGLSGGCDARTILNLLPKEGREIHSFTYGTENCGDVLCAIELAKVFETDETYVKFNQNDVEEDAKKVVWLTDGAAEPDLFFHVKMTRFKRNKARYEVSSVPGDAVSGKLNAQTQLLMAGERNFSTQKQREDIYKKMYGRMLMGKPSVYDTDIFSNKFVNDYAKKVEEDVYHSFIEECDSGKLTDMLLQSLLFQSTTGRTLPVMGGMPSVELTVRFPFLDYNVLDFFCRLPSSLWCGQKTYLEMISKHLKRAAEVPHYVTGKPISKKDNYLYIYLKVKDYIMRKFKIRQQHVFGSDTYDFKREILVNEAREYVLDSICKSHILTEKIFDPLTRGELIILMEKARKGDEKAFYKINSRFTASVLSELFFDKHNSTDSH